MGMVRFDAYALLLQGTGLLEFLDGLSTNHVTDSCTTVLTQRTGKIIDVCEVVNLGEQVALIGHGPQKEKVLNHLINRVLGRNITFHDISHLNDVFIGEGDQAPPPKSTLHTSFFGLMYIVPRSEGHQPTWTEHQWREHRIQRSIPFHGHEISEKHHPLACGLRDLVHTAKGCYVGQEVITRMISRGKQGHELVRRPNPAEGATTIGETESLCIVRTQ